jgi:hypothetical protein
VHICEDLFPPPWRWKLLTQVCRRWRSVILGSPRRLGLQVVCTKTTPTRTSLDIWPSLPIVVHCSCLLIGDEKGIENLIGAVEHRDRVSHFHVDTGYDSALEKVIAAMEEPLPFLTHLHLSSIDTSVVEELPETLGGSAPLLKSLFLSGIPFPTFPKFILSANNIAYLTLHNIPDFGYISPEVMTTCLAAMLNLKSLTLTIGYELPRYPPLSTNLLSPTRVVLPALINLLFSYIGGYSEAILGRIDTPLLNKLTIIFSRDVVIGDMPQIHNFIGRTRGLKPFSQASMELDYGTRKINTVLGYLESPTMFTLKIICQTIPLQLSPMTQIFGQRLPLLSHVEELQIQMVLWESQWRFRLDPSPWLQHLHLFVALRSLYVSKGLVKPIESALHGQELVGGRTMEVLPVLRELVLERLQPSEPTPEGIESFVAARELSGYPITIRNWIINEDEDLE